MLDIEIEEDGQIQTSEIIIQKDRKIELSSARKIYERAKTPEFKSDAHSVSVKYKTFDYCSKHFF